MSITRTLLDGQNLTLALTAPDIFVDILNVNIVTGKVTSAWLPPANLAYAEQAVALANSVVPPLDRTSLNYLARLVNTLSMDDSVFAGSSVLVAPDTYALRVTVVSGVDPAVLLVNMTHSITGAFGTADGTQGIAPPVLLAGDAIGPSNANVLVPFGPGAVTKGAADKSAIVTTDTKGRVFTLTEAAIQIAEAQVTNLVGDLAAKADKSVTITGADGCTGGGDLSANRTITLPAVGTAGTYGNGTTIPVLTTDAKGRVSNVVPTPIAFAPAGVATFGSYSLSNVGVAPASPPVIPIAPSVLVVPFDNVEDQNGCTLVAGTRLTVPSNGVYEFAFSPQIAHAGGGASQIFMWPRIDGTTPLTRGSSEVKLANNGDELFVFISVIIRLNAGQYVEWLMQSSNAGPTTLVTIAGSGAGATARPVNPAVIASVKLIGS